MSHDDRSSAHTTHGLEHRCRDVVVRTLPAAYARGTGLSLMSGLSIPMMFYTTYYVRATRVTQPFFPDQLLPLPQPFKSSFHGAMLSGLALGSSHEGHASVDRRCASSVRHVDVVAALADEKFAVSEQLADAEITKYKALLAVIGVMLLIVVVLAAIVIVRSHRKMIPACFSRTARHGARPSPERGVGNAWPCLTPCDTRRSDGHVKQRKVLPPMRCDEGCGACCGVAPATETEYRRVERYIEEEGITPVADGDELTCPFYQQGRCVVYPVRPLICKLFGTRRTSRLRARLQRQRARTGDRPDDRRQRSTDACPS